MASLAERYFRPKAIELDGRLYAWLGVVAFKRRLMSLVQVDAEQQPSNAYVLGGPGLEHLRAFERKSRRSELIHLVGLLAAVVVLAVSALRGPLLVTGMIVFAANFHCFILQRYNRIRIYNVLERASSRAQH